MKVLSIDWDYFVDATLEERLVLFPDGNNENILGNISLMIWFMKYIDARVFVGKDKYHLRTIESIPVKKEYYKLIELLSKQDDIICEVHESHSMCYDFIEVFKNIEIYNIDFHSDLRKDYDFVDCGNWLSTAFKNGIVKHAYWVADQHSCKHDLKIFQQNVTLIEFGDLMNIKFDAVFLCKSSIWSPPHLDSKYIGLVEFMEDLFYIDDYRLDKFDRFDGYEMNSSIEAEVQAIFSIK